MAEIPPAKPSKPIEVEEEMKTEKPDHAKTTGEAEVRTEEVTGHLLDCDPTLNLNTENKEISEEVDKNPQEDSNNKKPIDENDSMKKSQEDLSLNVEYIHMQREIAKKRRPRNYTPSQRFIPGPGSGYVVDHNHGAPYWRGPQNTFHQHPPMLPNQMYQPQERLMRPEMYPQNQIRAPMIQTPNQMMHYYPPQQLNQMGMVPNFVPNQVPMMHQPHHFMVPASYYMTPETMQQNQMMYNHHFRNMAPNGWPGSFVVDQNYYNQQQQYFGLPTDMIHQAPFPNAVAEAPWPELNQQRQQLQPQRQQSRRYNSGKSSRQGQDPQWRPR